MNLLSDGLPIVTGRIRAWATCHRGIHSEENHMLTRNDLMRRASILLTAALVAATIAGWPRPVQSANGPDSAPLRTIHLAAGQIVCRPGDIEGNLKQIDTLARKAAQSGARLCLFAEGAITGYVCTPAVLAAAPRRRAGRQAAQADGRGAEDGHCRRNDRTL